MGALAALRPNSTATFDATITAISPVREVSTTRGLSKVADATLSDQDGGTISLTLWGADTARFSVGQRVRVVDGWVKEYRGRLQVSTGRSGSIQLKPDERGTL